MDLSDAAIRLLLGEPRYKAEEVAERAGIELEQARRIWRAMGFAEPPDEPYFTDADLEVLATARRFVDAEYADPELIVAMARVLSQSVAQAASAQADAITERILSPDADIDGAEVPEVLHDLESFLVHIWRRHLASALEMEVALGPGRSEGAETQPISTVGFADLVGFTRLSRHLTDHMLTELVERFDAETQEIVSELGGRVVKTIGDEVMFLMREPREAAEAALQMVEAFPQGEDPPTVRVGLATGPVVRHRGDFFGPTVNLASRAVGEARPGTVLTSEETASHLKEHPDYEFKPLRPKRLKGVGSTRLWSLRRGIDNSDSAK